MTIGFPPEGLADILERIRDDEASRRKAVQQAALKTSSKDAPKGQGERTDFDKSSKLPQSIRATQNGVGVVTQRKLDRLARDYPEQHQRVKDGTLSVHAACVAAGIARRTVTVPVEPNAAARVLLNHFRGDSLLTLIRVLANHAGIALAEPEESAP